MKTLRASRREIFRLWLAEGNQEQGGHLNDLIQLAQQKKIGIERVPRSQLTEIYANHQGVALQVGGYRYASLPEMLALAKERTESPFILLLDLIQDPQNLGTLLRSAEGFGVHGGDHPLQPGSGSDPGGGKCLFRCVRTSAYCADESRTSN